ncbi:MAG TPA: Gfo/Idh/MocA family oxidoreductase [Candidatus Brachybacterium merdavium]|uniref:Gfo/Idh/MocA family oxidoreductase n=1 Tax=Candidatus Brachybacterium merdavium TaxID=2838513 RepID=A0A9D2LCQ4_9MICO|nr:Gfo/Idh/MocA family oxidoreductase [Candidatus Brachybacterium merdavium]
MTATAPVRIALIGTRGYGKTHLQNLERLTAAGLAELIGVVDIAEPLEQLRGIWHRDLAALLAAHAQAPPEVVIIATPIDTHVPLARQALAAGCHVYLEKPPVPALEDHWSLLEAAEAADRAVQVGFQARGGAGVDALREQLRSGALGPVESVRVHGAWTRDRAYYQRSPWAGRRRLEGRRVADGVATNPLAHGVHAGLVIAGIDRIEDIAAITTELRRAHDIEADDTTFLRIDPAGPGPAVLCALTTTAPVQRPPWVEISGPGGTWRLSYTEDLSWRTGPDGELTEHRHSRTDLVENLLTHVRDPQTALLSPLEASGAFSAVLEAIQSAPDPTVIDPEHVTWIGEGQAAHPVVDDIGDALHTALETGTAFSRNGVSWACADAITTWRPPGANQTPTARADGRGATQKETA